MFIMVEDDLPNGVVVVLVLVAILISILGTWTVIDVASSMPRAPVVEQRQSTGMVSFEILEKEFEDQTNVEVS